MQSGLHSPKPRRGTPCASRLNAPVNSPMGEDGVDASDAVDYLSDAQIYNQARHSEGFGALQAVLLVEKVEHRIQGSDRGLVQVFVEAKGDPACSGVGAGRGQVHVLMEPEGEVD